MISIIQNLFSDGNHTYATIVTIIAIILVIITMYNRIKYLCLEKAAAKVAEVEKIENLTGEQKFALVTLWINESLPAIFKSALFQTIIKKIIQYAYDNEFSYTKNYIKRKTGMDIGGLVESISNATSEAQEIIKSDSSMNNKKE